MGGLNELEAALREDLGELDFSKRDRAVAWHRDGAHASSTSASSAA